MIIGRETTNLGPSSVKATNITCSSAVISWLPANSNHQHVVCVNNVEVRSVKPGVYRHTITGKLIKCWRCATRCRCGESINSNLVAHARRSIAQHTISGHGALKTSTSTWSSTTPSTCTPTGRSSRSLHRLSYTCQRTARPAPGKNTASA